MKNSNINALIDKCIIGITVMVFILAFGFKIYNFNFLGIYLMIINIYMILKYKDKKIFLLMIMMLYFNYSFVVCKYIGEESNLLKSLYAQLSSKNTMLAGILFQILFLVIINIILGNKKNNVEIFCDGNIFFRYRKWVIFELQILLIIILFYHLIKKITVNTTLFEYSIILFIFLLYLCKDDKKNRIFSEIVLLLFAIYSLKNGDRIAVLQFMIVDFSINYIEKIRKSTIILFIIGGIFIFTFLGLYGDILDAGKDMKVLNFEYTIQNIKDRRLALDTSVSAYFSGLSMIDVSNKYTIKERIKDGIIYFTNYTLNGARSGYIQVGDKIRDYQINYGGGFLTCYFYFWFGWIGVMLISVYIGIILKKIFYSQKHKMYVYIFTIYFVSTAPRWYMYAPSLLFRGFIFFNIIYLLIKILLNGGLKRRNARETIN